MTSLTLCLTVEKALFDLLHADGHLPQQLLLVHVAGSGVWQLRLVMLKNKTKQKLKFNMFLCSGRMHVILHGGKCNEENRYFEQKKESI